MSKRARQPAPSRATSWLAGALLFVAVFVAYRPAASGVFLWDDDDYVWQNPNLRSPHGLVEIWFHPARSPQYYPVTFTTFWLEYQIFKNDPRGYHEINILLHAASALLLWRILLRLRVPGAWLAAAVFALHPVMVESVAWITERKNALSLFFYLASMYAYLRFANIDDDTSEVSPPRWRAYAASLLFFLAALGSKTVTATLPAALLLIFWWKHRLTRRHVALLTPFLLLGLAAGASTAFLERTEVGAAGPEWNYSPLQRLLIASRAPWFYAGKLLWPTHLTFIYPKWPVDPADAVQWLFPLALLLALTLLVAFRRRIGRGPLVAVLIFLATLLPALGFVNVYPMRYTFVADHYQYHASLAPIVLFVAAAVTFARRRNLARRYSIALPGTAALLLLTLAALTFAQSRVYHSPQSLWTDTLAKNPTSWMASLNLAHAQESTDKPAAAQSIRKALALAPSVADPYYDMGLIYLDENNLPAATAEFHRAVELEPRHAPAHNMLGYCLVARHDVQAGIAHYRRALAIRPRYVTAHFNLGIALRDTGDLDAAAREFSAALESDPDFAPALRELANHQIHRADYQAAANLLRRLTNLQPNNAEAHFDLATALHLLHQDAEAQSHLLKAQALNPHLK
jgi:tetratricopeptide (TPR) repeat protein